MIKVFKARVSKDYQVTQKQIDDMIQEGYYFPNGIMIEGEQFLLYKNTKGHFVNTVARNCKNKSVDRLPVTPNDGADIRETLNLIQLDISSVIYVKNKKELTKLISEFNYEKGIDIKWKIN